MTTTFALEEGTRSIGTADVYDLDDKTHEVVMDFPYRSIDAYKTDFDRGCFDDSLKRSLPPMCWQHDPTEPIGRAIRYEDLGDRLRIVNRFSDLNAVPRARQAFTQMRDGDLTGASFHYRNARAVPHPSVRGGKRFTRAQMMETSPVTFPAIPGAGVVGIRGLFGRSPVTRPDAASVIESLDESIARYEARRIGRLRLPDDVLQRVHEAGQRSLLRNRDELLQRLDRRLGSR